MNTGTIRHKVMHLTLLCSLSLVPGICRVAQASIESDSFSRPGDETSIPFFKPQAQSQGPNGDHSSNALFGHNLTPTSDTLHAGQVTAGSYVLAVGITDHLTFGMNPWLAVNYNMSSFGLKYAIDLHGFLDRVAFETYYMKTYHVLLDWYHQSSTFSRLTGTTRITPGYRIHSCIGFQYFYDDLAAFSLRPPPLNKTPVTLATSVLQQAYISKSLGFFLESGILGINYPNRYLHLGLSSFYEASWGYVQVGVSKTMPVGGTRLEGLPDEVWVDPHGYEHYSVFYKYSAPFHPEFQIQWMF